MTALHVETSGDGAPLVLWHGWGMNQRVFDELRTALAATHRVIAVDLPGHGRSAWSAADAATQVQQLLETVPAGAVLLGWSLGSQLALRAALAAPDRLRALILVSATPRFVAAGDWPHGIDMAVLQQFAAGLQYDQAQTVADFFALQMRGSRCSAQQLAQLRASVLQHGAAQPAALSAGLRLLTDSDLRVEATRIVTPTLVIGGQHDRVAPPGAGLALSRLIPGAAHVQIARAAHAPFVSHPAELLGALREFLLTVRAT